ncbi:hypothetical protein [Arenicella xantha]|nr:hypothetical protein [Arenicella xantha]
MDSELSAEQISKMSSRDFDAKVTINIHDGDLKGEYVFERNPEVNREMFSISVERGPGYKDDVTKQGAIGIHMLQQTDGPFELKLLSKEFIGMIKVGNYPAREMKGKQKDRLIFTNKDSSTSWVKADGALQTLNDVEFTYVGEWLDIKGKNEARRVEGTYTDDVTFEYYDRAKLLATETVSVTVNFSGVQGYNALMSDHK